MIRRPPETTRTATLVPYTTLFRSAALFVAFPGDQSEDLPAMVSADQLDPAQMLMLEDGHCLKDHVLAACNRPELRAGARMMGTSLHTLVQMVDNGRSEEHTSELQSLMRNSYAVFCLQKKKQKSVELPL